ncbi:uncharacterized protein BP5553_07105 [Venustampulla echinocandica]|uniref:glucan 1,3-beta-glucosidase n=1 Tax=Venustampulla echinocandica TaxID=2656787 RepID=A0A370TII1_9HELO|nr:uncharacterized protein BP5553_07105 [Venustampulla echinocandica]RDL35174.1 hypothetical protein BP5553_07105 [Venustampulla echinocandica]
MWASLSTASMAILVLADAATARLPRREAPVDAEAETGSPEPIIPTITVTHTNIEYWPPTTLPVTVTNTNVKFITPTALSNSTAHNSTGTLVAGKGHRGKGKGKSSATTLTPANSKAYSPVATFAPSLTSASAAKSSQPSSSSAVASPKVLANTSSIPFLRGVNLGGWFILEKWMNSDVFTGAFSEATDQFTFDAIPGAEDALEKHWSTYFTESDIQDLAATGINALRIPIGYWAFDNSNSHYIKGADVYLEKAIDWARNAGMKVWVDCHGSPGSQNGHDHSGKIGSVDWQEDANRKQSISVLETMASKYGSAEYADVVVGLELTNEPLADSTHSLSEIQEWTEEAYAAVKAASSNPNMVITIHDAFQGPEKWADVVQNLGPGSFGIDTHMYQLFSDEDNLLTQPQHITKACGWASSLATSNAITPTYTGEWSGITNVCLNPDGSTIAGHTCWESGCRCLSDPYETWSDDMIALMRRYVEAQLDVFEQSTSGYFVWSAKGPGSWSFLEGVKKGTFPNPVTARKFPGQCGGNQRRATRGSLGREPEAF